MIPSAAELVSGFWSDGPAVGPADAYAAGAFVQGRNATTLGAEASVRGWRLRADQMITPGPDGRPTFGYPAPTEPPVWIAADLVGGRVWVAGTDFTVSAGYVWFTTDPISAGPPGVLWVDGTPIQATVLMSGSRRPTPLPTEYLDATLGALVAAIAAACDSPATGPDVETVEAITGYAVVTDRAAYQLPPADLPTVSVGDILQPFTPLGGAWRLTRLGSPPPNLPYLTLPADFYPLSGVTAPVAWYNHDVPTVIDTVSTRTRIRWRLGGTLADVNAVWTASHAWGTLAGNRTLAQALDTRANPTTEPTSDDLPESINPMAFLCRDVLAGCGYLLVVTPAKFGVNAAPAATRQARVTAAAGPFTVVVEWEDAQPAPAETTPTP